MADQHPSYLPYLTCLTITFEPSSLASLAHTPILLLRPCTDCDCACALFHLITYLTGRACLPFLTFLLLLLPLPGTCLIDDTPSWISPPPPPPPRPPLASIALLATKPGRRLVAATCLGFIITLPLPEIRGSVQERYVPWCSENCRRNIDVQMG
ncbi:uncharacterized protein BKA78DRAFT_296936 [Phyllosticta capitalensis]|uniref:uncharacterized protein n=1 Tax=Phyllosticta capitalensis TaxID=121624 RepID=UPI00313120EC